MSGKLRTATALPLLALGLLLLSAACGSGGSSGSEKRTKIVTTLPLFALGR